MARKGSQQRSNGQRGGAGPQRARLEHKTLFTRRALILGAGGVAAWAGLIGRLAQIQLQEGEIYKELAEENRVKFTNIPAPRGVILDRYGAVVAGNGENYQILLTPLEAMRSDQGLQGVIDAIAEILGRDAEWARATYARARRGPSFRPVLVADDLTWEQFARANVQRPILPGANPEKGERRMYPFSGHLAHVVGYVQKPDDRTIESDPAMRHPDARVGRYGVELFKEDALRGKAGVKHQIVTAGGRVLKDNLPSSIKPAAGKDVRITIDAELQMKIYERLRFNREGEEIGQQSAGVVVMDIRSGDLIAVVSSPSFDPNPFVQGYPYAAYAALRDNIKRPLYDKALKGAMPPASTFKIVVALAALELGISPNRRVHCSGRYWFGNRFWHCWKKEGHGAMAMRSGMKHSCDVYFYDLAKEVGPEAIARTAEALGLGRTYDPSIGDQLRGVVPSPAWKRRRYNEPWYDGDTLNFSIGQGEALATPLQLAVMTARVASGLSLEPRLVFDGTPVAKPEPLPFKPENLEFLRESLWATANEWGGTAIWSGDLKFDGMRLAGKTGTAQARNITMAERATGVIDNEDLDWELRDHALFVAYAPHDAPIYAAAAIVEHGGSGSYSAAPVVRDALAEALRREKERTSAPLTSLGAASGVGVLGPRAQR